MPLSTSESRRRIVDSDGDLLADAILCPADGPRIMDGPEFENPAPMGDVLGDEEFLAMDLGASI